jgi:predicted permease
MKLREAWKYAKIVAVESMLKGQLLMSGGQTSVAAQRDPARFVRRVKSSFNLNKAVFAVFFGLFSFAVPLFFLGPNSTNALRFVMTSVFLLFELVFLVSFNLLNLTSLVSGESLKPVASLPFSRADLSRISVLSFFRMLDYPLIVFILGYPIAYGLVTSSVAAAAVVLALSTVDGVMAVFLTFFLARGFYRKILPIGGSRVKGLIRTVTTLLYGFLTFGMAYFIAYIFQFTPQLVSFFAFIQSPAYTWITLIFPFSFGYLATLLTSQFTVTSSPLSLTSLQSMMAISASAFYILLGYLAFRKGMGALRQLALGEIEMTPKMTRSGEIRLQVRGVYSSVIRKDFKLASRNAAYAGLLAMPIFGVILFTLITSSYQEIRVASVISAVAYSSFFMVFFALSTMWFESRGVSVLSQLPISTRKVVQAKSLVSGALSLTIPAALTAVSFFKPLSTRYSLLIALIETAAIYAGALIATTLSCSLFGEGRLPASSFEGQFLKYAFVMIISGIFVTVPVGAYGLTYLFIEQSHLTATAVMAVFAVAEIGLANAIARAALRD